MDDYARQERPTRREVEAGLSTAAGTETGAENCVMGGGSGADGVRCMLVVAIDRKRQRAVLRRKLLTAKPTAPTPHRRQLSSFVISTPPFFRVHRRFRRVEPCEVRYGCVARDRTGIDMTEGADGSALVMLVCVWGGARG